MDFSNNINPLILRRIIIDHYNDPNNLLIGPMNKNYIKKFCKSNSCIDEIYVYIDKDKEKINDIKFNGVACSICIAGTDIIIDLINGKNISEANKIISEYINMIDGKDFKREVIGEAICLSNTYKLPLRKKCALLGVNGIYSVIN